MCGDSKFVAGEMYAKIKQPHKNSCKFLCVIYHKEPCLSKQD